MLFYQIMDYRDTRAYILDPCIQEFLSIEFLFSLILTSRICNRPDKQLKVRIKYSDFKHILNLLKMGYIA